MKQYESFENSLNDRRQLSESLYFFDVHGAQSFYTLDYRQDGYLICGCETKGPPRTILEGMGDRIFNISTRSPLDKSLNVAAAVAYQSMRNQLGG